MSVNKYDNTGLIKAYHSLMKKACNVPIGSREFNVYAEMLCTIRRVIKNRKE